MLNERSQIQKRQYYTISLIHGILKKKKKTQIYRDRVEWWLSGLRGEGDGEILVKGYMLSDE